MIICNTYTFRRSGHFALIVEVEDQGVNKVLIILPPHIKVVIYFNVCIIPM